MNVTLYTAVSSANHLQLTAKQPLQSDSCTNFSSCYTSLPTHAGINYFHLEPPSSSSIIHRSFVINPSLSSSPNYPPVSFVQVILNFFSTRTLIYCRDILKSTKTSQSVAFQFCVLWHGFPLLSTIFPLHSCRNPLVQTLRWLELVCSQICVFSEIRKLFLFLYSWSC